MEPNLGQNQSIVPVAGGRSFSTFVEAVSPSMRALEAVIPELAHSSVPVLLMGEPGTGKHTIALRIHQNSGGVEKPFQVVDCHDLAAERLMRERFLPEASVYFDEIGVLNLECQQKLFELVSHDLTNGGSRNQVRVICGNSQDLEAEVRAGNFREDLYYRLSGVCLRIPPLRQRKEDVPQLMTFFLERYSQSFARPIPALSTATQKLFLEHSWPGNLTELEAAARAIVALGDESVAMDGLRALLTRSDRSNGERMSLKDAARAASREAERELILKVLTRTRWNRRRAAQELQISYKALLYKLKQVGYGEYGAFVASEKK